jgi:hypothetical protein
MVFGIFNNIYKKDLIYQINELNNKLSLTISISLQTLEDKFVLLPPGDGSSNDEFWYLILKKTQQYLLLNYNERINEITTRQLRDILKYINWFKSSWPPKISRSKYLLPATMPPPEIIFI